MHLLWRQAQCIPKRSFIALTSACICLAYTLECSGFWVSTSFLKSAIASSSPSTRVYYLRFLLARPIAGMKAFETHIYGITHQEVSVADLMDLDSPSPEALQDLGHNAAGAAKKAGLMLLDTHNPGTQTAAK
jgi:hypothetical protein